MKLRASIGLDKYAEGYLRKKEQFKVQDGVHNQHSNFSYDCGCYFMILFQVFN
jgi:hypothetical protein